MTCLFNHAVSHVPPNFCISSPGLGDAQTLSLIRFFVHATAGIFTYSAPCSNRSREQKKPPSRFLQKTFVAVCPSHATSSGRRGDFLLLLDVVGYSEPPRSFVLLGIVLWLVPWHPFPYHSLSLLVPTHLFYCSLLTHIAVLL